MVTQSAVDELLAKMHEERETLLARVVDMSEAQAEHRPPDKDGEDGWSVKEQLTHLAMMEVTYRAWVQQAVTEDRPHIGRDVARDPAAYPLEQAHEASVPQLVAELEQQRERTLAYVATLTPEQFERRATTEAFGELTVLQYLRSYYRHDRMHLAQIEDRPSDYQPRFLTGEPDQRRRA